jgi:hypothetical protein
MEQIPLFNNSAEQNIKPSLEQNVDPMTDSTQEPDFALFSDADNVLSVRFFDGRWHAIYKNDDPGESYRH